MDTQSWTNSQTYISVLMQALLLVCWARSGSPALCSVISGCWWEYWAPVCSYSCIHECIPSVMFSALTKVCASASFTSSLFKVLGMPVCVCVCGLVSCCVFVYAHVSLSCCSWPLMTTSGTSKGEQRAKREGLVVGTKDGLWKNDGALLCDPCERAAGL